MAHLKTRSFGGTLTFVLLTSLPMFPIPAITRARKRVVILSRSTPMRRYLHETLSCNLEKVDAVVALKEFETKATQDEWAVEGRKYFKDQQYRLAEGSIRNLL